MRVLNRPLFALSTAAITCPGDARLARWTQSARTSGDCAATVRLKADTTEASAIEEYGDKQQSGGLSDNVREMYYESFSAGSRCSSSRNRGSMSSPIASRTESCALRRRAMACV